MEQEAFSFLCEADLDSVTVRLVREHLQSAGFEPTKAEVRAIVERFLESDDEDEAGPKPEPKKAEKKKKAPAAKAEKKKAPAKKAPAGDKRPAKKAKSEEPARIRQLKELLRFFEIQHNFKLEHAARNESEDAWAEFLENKLAQNGLNATAVLGMSPAQRREAKHKFELRRDLDGIDGDNVLTPSKGKRRRAGAAGDGGGSDGDDNNINNSDPPSSPPVKKLALDFISDDDDDDDD